MGRVTKRDAVAMILVALVCGIVSDLPPFNSLDVLCDAPVYKVVSVAA